jgi:hypothetical protein
MLLNALHPKLKRGDKAFSRRQRTLKPSGKTPADFQRGDKIKLRGGKIAQELAVPVQATLADAI